MLLTFFIFLCYLCYTATGTNQFMLALMSSSTKEHFGEALIWILNKQSSPYDNGPLLKQSLNALQDLFSEDSSAGYFYTNDLKGNAFFWIQLKKMCCVFIPPD